MSARSPRPLKGALDELKERLAPATTLSRVQSSWELAAGEAIAAHARPAAERAGVLTVLCESSVWAQELELMAPELTARLNERLGAEVIRELRCRTG